MISLFRRRFAAVGLEDESGFTLIELIASLSIMAIAFFALALGASTGLRLVAQGRQREAAAEVANARLEHLRNIPYTQVALDAGLTRSADVTDPDYYVSDDGTQFDHSGSGDFEDLIVDTTEGQVAHLETPVSEGETTLSVHQYVTWVDDAAITGSQNYKRLTVIVTYIAAIPVGRPRTVQASALFTTEGVIISGATPGATQGSSTPTVSPTPTPTPTGACSTDTAGPTGDFTLLSGTGATTGFTASTNLSVSLAPVDSCTPITYQLSNDGSTWGAVGTYDSTNPSVTWTITATDGVKTVYGRFFDSKGNMSSVGPHSITLDGTKPTTPGTLTKTAWCSGSNRTVTLNWGTSTDTHWLGYRLYKSVNNGSYTVVATTGSTSYSDTDKKNLDSLAYKVVSYDKAGNESTATNVKTLAKNQCS